MRKNINQTMKKLIFTLVVVVLAACSATTADKKQEKEEELKTYKKQLSDLKKKVAKLEEELSDGSSESVVAVVATPIEPMLFEHFINVSGKVEADKNIIVSPEASGKIVSIEVKEG